MEEIKNRKKILAEYGGSIESYNNKNDQKFPQIIFIINNYEGLLESYSSIYEEIISIGRDCERYGIVLIITCNSPATIGRRVSQCFGNKYAFHLIDVSDYYSVFNAKCRIKPRNVLGRGLVDNDGIHEFQTASIVDDGYNINDYIEKFAVMISENNTEFATPIPSLPDKVTFDFIQKEVSTIQKVPIGISKNSLKTVKYDFTAFSSTTITSNKLANINSFMDSLLDIFIKISDLNVYFIDLLQLLPEVGQKEFNNKRIGYIDKDFDITIDKLIEMDNDTGNNNENYIYIFYGLERLKTKVDVTKIEILFDSIKKGENSKLIFCDSTKNLKSLDFDPWYSKIKNNTDGIWVGNGFSEQQNFRVSKITKEMSDKYHNNYGFCLTESNAELIKLLEFGNILGQGDDEIEE
jgi:hypothetical protein